MACVLMMCLSTPRVDNFNPDSAPKCSCLTDDQKALVRPSITSPHKKPHRSVSSSLVNAEYRSNSATKPEDAPQHTPILPDLGLYTAPSFSFPPQSPTHPSAPPLPSSSFCQLGHDASWPHLITADADATQDMVCSSACHDHTLDSDPHSDYPIPGASYTAHTNRQIGMRLQCHSSASSFRVPQRTASTDARSTIGCDTGLAAHQSEHHPTSPPRQRRSPTGDSSACFDRGSARLWEEQQMATYRSTLGLSSLSPRTVSSFLMGPNSQTGPYSAPSATCRMLAHGGSFPPSGHRRNASPRHQRASTSQVISTSGGDRTTHHTSASFSLSRSEVKGTSQTIETFALPLSYSSSTCTSTINSKATTQNVDAAAAGAALVAMLVSDKSNPPYHYVIPSHHGVRSRQALAWCEESNKVRRRWAR